jgi:hypothetical protein
MLRVTKRLFSKIVQPCTMTEFFGILDERDFYQARKMANTRFDVNSFDTEGRNALLFAASRKDSEMVHFLIDVLGADVSKSQPYFSNIVRASDDDFSHAMRKYCSES